MVQPDQPVPFTVKGRKGWLHQQLEILISKYQNQNLVILSLTLGIWISLPILKLTGSIQSSVFRLKRHQVT